MSDIANATKFEQVFARELVEIALSRESRYEPPREGPDQPAETRRAQWSPSEAKPATERNLVGLCFSGGGVRSATFNLGAIQALLKNDVLRHIDYLSTVSGGGYISSCLMRLAHEGADPRRGGHALEHTDDVEGAHLQHLRTHASYLAPGGRSELLTLPALIVRGTVIGLFTATGLVMALVLATLGPFGAPRLGSELVVPQGWDLLLALGKWFPLTTLGGVIFFLVAGLYYFIGDPLLRWWAPKLLLQRLACDRWLSLALLALAGVVGMETLPIVFAYVFRHGVDQATWGSAGAWLAGCGTVLGLLFRSGLERRHLMTLGRLLGLVVACVLGPLLVLGLYLLAGHLYLAPHAGRLSDVVSEPSAIASLRVEYLLRACIPLLILRTIVAWAHWLVGPNAFSPYGYYRDRLSRAYLSDRTGLSQAALKPHELETRRGPYPIFNAAVNLQGSKDPALRGRGADFFAFTPLWCGSERTGWIDTARLCKHDPQLDLGTVVAVSAAAASPNAGTFRLGNLTMLLALLNIRLGYWLPNPSRLGTSGVGPWLRVKEMLGLLSEDDDYLNVSDGGHIENLGLFELLRRRCRLIIVCDAEEDPGITCLALSTVMSFARMQLATHIDLDLRELTRDPATGRTARHCAWGTIQYSDGERGYLLYVKSSLTGDEDHVLRGYAATHPTFPHESTVDQFFDQDQFEAYRALGHHIVDGAIRGWRQGEKVATSREFIDQFVRVLDERLRPSLGFEEAFTGLQAQLSALETDLQPEDLAAYVQQVYPELEAGDPPSAEHAEAFRKVFHVVTRQVQLMENAFVELRLDERAHREDYFNRGWMNLFRRWSQSPDFQRAWVILIGCYSRGFQAFCSEELGLGLELTWNVPTPTPWGPRIERDLQAAMALASDLPLGVSRAELVTLVGAMQLRIDPARNRGVALKQPLCLPAAVVQYYTRGGTAHIAHYEILARYSRMDLLGQLFEKLFKQLPAAEGERPHVVFTDKHYHRRYRSFFKELEYEVDLNPTPKCV